MLDLDLARTKHFACEIDPISGRKAASLKRACGMVAVYHCVSVLSSQNAFYACGPHTPRTGYHVSKAVWPR